MTHWNRPGSVTPSRRMVRAASLVLALALGALACSDSSIDTPEPYAPRLDKLEPSVVAFGDTDVTVRIYGVYLTPDMIAFWNDTPLTTTFDEYRRPIAHLRNEDLERPNPSSTNPVLARITLRDTLGQGGTSNALVLQVVEPVSPGVIQSIEPDSLMVGSPAQEVSLRGTGFRDDSLVLLDGAPFPMSFVDSNLVTFTVLDSVLQHGGEISVQLFSLAPGSVRSNSVVLTSVNPLPRMDSFNPPHITAGQGTQTITFQGEGFVADTVVRLDGREFPTYSRWSGALQADIPGEFIRLAGLAHLSLFNPGPGGGATDVAEVLLIQQIDVAARDLAYDPNLDRLYAVSSYDDGLLCAIAPATGEIIYTVPTQHQPVDIVLTEDGQFGYVLRYDYGCLVRYAMATGEQDMAICDFGAIYAVTPLVGQPHSCAVTRHNPDGPPSVRVDILDDRVRRPVIGPTDGTGYHECGRLMVRTSDPLVLISSSRGELNGLKRIQVTPDGTRVADTSLEGPQGVDFRDLQYCDGRIYTGAGLVIDEQTLEVVYDFQTGGSMAVDGKASQIYYLTGPLSDWEDFLIKVFDLETGDLEGEIALEMHIGSSPLVKVGDDALAISFDGIQLIRSPLLIGTGSGR